MYLGAPPAVPHIYIRRNYSTQQICVIVRVYLRSILYQILNPCVRYSTVNFIIVSVLIFNLFLIFYFSVLLKDYY
jgi:hypothetical protein